MSGIREFIAAQLETPPANSKLQTFDGLRVTVFRSGTINIDRHPKTDDRRELSRADVDAVRAVFSDLGLIEMEAWLPVQGMSWLSNGVSAGVSFKVSKDES